jgi:hypothetical protein
MLRSFVSRASFALAFGASAAAVWFGGARAVRLSGADRLPVTLDFAASVEQWHADLSDDRGSRRIAFVGDSMLWGFEGGTPLPDSVLRIVNRSVPRNRRSSIHTLSWGALTMDGEYCIADELIAAKPTLLVLELNLRALQPGPLGPASYSELAGFIRWPRLAEAAFVNLSDAGITLDRLLFYRFLVANHFEGAWLGLLDLQSRLFNSQDILEGWLEKKTDVETVATRRRESALYSFARLLIPHTAKATAAHTTEMLGAVLDGLDDDNSRLRVLKALLRDLRRANVPLLVWVSPVNVQHMRHLGMSMDGLDRSLRTIREAVEATGARFLDLHAILPDEGFRDSGDHYTLSGELDGAALVAARLGPAVERAATAATPTAPAPSSKNALQ